MIDILKQFLGNKSQRDIKEIIPLVDKALEFDEEFRKLSNDDLRAKTVEFRERIHQHIEVKGQEIADLKTNLSSDEIEIEEKEKLYPSGNRSSSSHSYSDQNHFQFKKGAN